MPHHKTLDEYDFSYQPELDPRKVRDLATLAFAEARANAALLGPACYQRFRLVIAAFLQVISMLRLMERGYVAASWPFQPRRVSSRRSCRFSP